MQREYFFELMRMQIRKHNGRYLKGISNIRAVVGDQITGVIFARLVGGKDLTPTEVQQFVSKIYKTTIDLQHLYSFLMAEALLTEIQKIKGFSQF